MKGTVNGLNVAAALLVVLTGAFGGVAAADHGSPANFTVSPQDVSDRNPDVTEGTYAMRSAGADAFESERGLEVVDYYSIESEQADFTACSPDNARVFGIDRGNNNTGTQTDVDLLQHMEDYTIDGNQIALSLYGESDFGGETINLNAPDATVAVLGNCIENTGDAGWYQFQGYVNGTNYNGEYEEVYLTSHYFWMGDFESEAAAREELGPPPSESGGDGQSGDDGQSTPTPTGDDSGTDGADASTPEPATPTPTDGSSGAGSNDDGGAGNDRTDGSDSTTPTLGNGPGFGPVAAILALLASALLVRRR